MPTKLTNFSWWKKLWECRGKPKKSKKRKFTAKRLETKNYDQQLLSHWKNNKKRNWASWEALIKLKSWKENSIRCDARQWRWRKGEQKNCDQSRNGGDQNPGKLRSLNSKEQDEITFKSSWKWKTTLLTSKTH